MPGRKGTPTTDKPFRDAMSELLRESDYVTQTGNVNWHAFSRDMETTSKNGEFVSYEALRKVLAGKRNVTAHVIEECARVLRVPPTYFVEYRAMEAARAFDVREVGFDAVLDNLERWTAEQAAKRETSSRRRRRTA